MLKLLSKPLGVVISVAGGKPSSPQGVQGAVFGVVKAVLDRGGAAEYARSPGHGP